MKRSLLYYKKISFFFVAILGAILLASISYLSGGAEPVSQAYADLITSTTGSGSASECESSGSSAGTC